MEKLFSHLLLLFNFQIYYFIFIVSGRDERKVGDKPKEFLAVACTSDELNKFRVEYEKCHQKAVGMIEEQRPLGGDISLSRYDYYCSQILVKIIFQAI